MYWLLGAGKQGSEEAVEILTGIAGNGRGVTDQNYVDVVNITCVLKNITKANLPYLDGSLNEITYEFGIMDVFSCRLFILSFILAFYIHQVIKSQIQVSSSSHQ
jgi:hypothetical protein